MSSSLLITRQLRLSVRGTLRAPVTSTSTLMATRANSTAYEPVTEIARDLRWSRGDFASASQAIDPCEKSAPLEQVPVFGVTEDGVFFYEIAALQRRDGRCCFVMLNRPRVGSFILLPVSLLGSGNQLPSAEVLRVEQEGDNAAVYAE